MHIELEGMLNVKEEKPIVASSSTIKQCAICGDFAYSKHFRVMSCRACAAFFRRTISLKRKYTCMHSDECLITSEKNLRHACRFCRFQKCIQKGMNLDAITDRNPDELRNFPDTLRSIVLSQRSTFVNRYVTQLKANGGNATLVRMGKDNPVFANLVTVASEFPVLIEYLKGSGFESYGLNGMEIAELGKETFYSWICYNSVINTLRNNGHKLNLSYFIDESFVKVSEESVANFVRTQPGLFDYDLAARVTMECCAENLESAARFHRIRIDEFEQATLFHIFALKTAARIFPKHVCLKPELNKLFQELKQYYLQNYDDVAIRMGNLLLILNNFSHWSTFLAEYVMTLHLIGYNSVLNKLESEN